MITRRLIDRGLPVDAIMPPFSAIGLYEFEAIDQLLLKLLFQNRILFALVYAGFVQGHFAGFGGTSGKSCKRYHDRYDQIF